MKVLKWLAVTARASVPINRRRNKPTSSRSHAMKMFMRVSPKFVEMRVIE